MFVLYHLNSHENQRPKMQITKGSKLRCTLRLEKKIITAWEDLGNPNFPHILCTSVIIYQCDKSVITKSHMWSWFVITPFSSAERNNMTDFNSVKDTYTRYWLQLRLCIGYKQSGKIA